MSYCIYCFIFIQFKQQLFKYFINCYGGNKEMFCIFNN